MANPFPANFEGVDGSRRLTGQVNFTDPANQPGGSSYTAPITRQYLAGSDVAIGNNGLGKLTWDNDLGPNALLNLSVLNQPTIVTAGVYVIATQVFPDSAMTVGGWYEVTLHLDVTGDDVTIQQDASSIAARTQPTLTLTASYYLAAGAGINVSVNNHDGVTSINFLLNSAIVQRVS